MATAAHIPSFHTGYVESNTVVTETVASYKRKFVLEVLVNCLFKLVQENVWLGELTVPPSP